MSVDHFAEVLGARHAQLALAVGHDDRPVVLVEENFAARGTGQHRARRHAFHLHHESHVIFLVLAREKRLANVEFVEDAAEGPHVDSAGVGDAEDDLGRAIEARLNVRVDLLVFETARAEIDNLDSRLVNLSEQDVFRLQVTMHDVMLAHVVKRDQDLDREPLDQAEREAQEVVHLDEVIEVDGEELEGEDQMLAEDEVVQALYDILLVFRVVSVQRFNQFRLYQALLVEAFLVLQDLKRHEFL